VSEALRLLAELRRQGANPSGVSADSRQIARGDLFVALPGARRDGRDFIPEAVARGAVGVLRESAGGFGRGDESPLAVPNVAAAQLQAIGGELANVIYDFPSTKLWMVGVTGTNGKTTVSQWISQALNASGRKCGVIGTLGSGFPGNLSEILNTTPDAISLQRTLAGFVGDGANACAMEVSSIGLDQGRTDAVNFDVAVFTNLTRDHLDYHPGMAAYAAAKTRLFEGPGLKAAVLNLDDACGVRLGSMLAGKGVWRIGYTLDRIAAGAAAGAADEVLAAENLDLSGQGLAFSIRSGQGEVSIGTRILGRFNASNLLAVAGSLLAAGISLEQTAALLPQLVPPPGRMQGIGGDGKPLLVLDYAHTPDALEQTLLTLREIALLRGHGRLNCVFGCGGERDPGKRPLMGEVAARLADASVVTSDNPRGEDPRTIIDAILVGMPAATPVEVDRALAIRSVVRNARSNDVVLIAGKGHELYQEIAGRRLPFSDLQHAQTALAQWSAAV